MSRKSGTATPIEHWETDSVDSDERQLAEQLVEESSNVKKGDPSNGKRVKEDSFEIYAHDSHRWSPVTHYLEPYL